jgi:asparaginyl-tRNA synthetase
MKTLFVKDLLRGSKRDGSHVTLLCWVKARRNLGKIVFLDLCDSTGVIQAVVSNEDAATPPPLDVGTEPIVALPVSLKDVAKAVPLESAVEAIGIVQQGKDCVELHLTELKIVGAACTDFCPRPRSNIDIFDHRLTEQLLSNRHLYLRNERVAAILRFRHRMMLSVHNWFSDQGFTEITAPVLTPTPLYEDGTAMSLTVHDERTFLTQCVGFYLESAVHSFERVYNMGPSFRAEESRSKRHLMEYWHIKAELAWVNRDDLMALVESLISHLVGFCQEHCADIFQTLDTTLSTEGLQTPFPRMDYSEAVDRLHDLGMPFTFGTSLGSVEEEALSKQFKTPFWVVGIPRTIEPFPYVIDPVDPRVTRTADLIASRGYGELLGIAEKIHTLPMLDERMQEKKKAGDPRYEWLRQMREYGCVPHGGFGMGVERCIRWLLDVPHVRDTMPFPRIFRRKIAP